MVVIPTGHSYRRNGMAYVFAGLDNADIEYLASLTASSSTPSLASLTGTYAPEISDHDPSLNTENSSCHQSDVDDHDDHSTDHMVVIPTGQSCRRNGMAYVFAGLDNADIEYLASLTASSSTSSLTILTGTYAPVISDHDPSLNTENPSCHPSDADDHDDHSTDHR